MTTETPIQTFTALAKPAGEVNEFQRCQKCGWGMFIHYLFGSWRRTRDCHITCPRCSHVSIFSKRD